MSSVNKVVIEYFKKFYLRNISADETPLIRRLPILTTGLHSANCQFVGIQFSISGSTSEAGLDQTDGSRLDLGPYLISVLTSGLNLGLLPADKRLLREHPPPSVTTVAIISRKNCHNQSWKFPDDKTVLKVQMLGDNLNANRIICIIWDGQLFVMIGKST